MPILVAMDAKKKTLSRKQVAYSMEILLIIGLIKICDLWTAAECTEAWRGGSK
jgi:hypothetical protein